MNGKVFVDHNHRPQMLLILDDRKVLGQMMMDILRMQIVGLNQRTSHMDWMKERILQQEAYHRTIHRRI